MCKLNPFVCDDYSVAEEVMQRLRERDCLQVLMQCLMDLGGQS